MNAVLRWVGRWGRATRWLEGAGANRAWRVADIGCAFGFGTARLASTGAWVVGIEPDRAYVRRAARDHPGIAFVQATATCLPFRDGVVDAVTLLDVLEHVSVPDNTSTTRRTGGGQGCPRTESATPPAAAAKAMAAREAARVLTVGGHAMITVPASGPAAWLDSLNRYNALARRARGWLPVDATEITPGAAHLHFGDDGLASLLRRAGLEVVRSARFGTGVLPELVHLAILVLTRGVAKSERAYRRWRFVYFALHVLDDAVPVPWIGYSLSVLARSVRRTEG